MNNKRAIFYFISFLILTSLYAIFVLSAGADTTEGLFRVVINNITDKRGTTPLRLNITTGENLNLTCSGERANNGSAADYLRKAVVSNISLYHSFNSTYASPNMTLNITNTTNATNSITMLQVNLTGLFANFRVQNGTISFNPNGDWNGTSTFNEGNFTVACAAATNNTGTFNYSSNITITIDRVPPNFTLTDLNVTDGTTTVKFDLMNGTDGGEIAFLKNMSNLTLTLGVVDPYVDSVRVYWTANGSGSTVDFLSEFRTRENARNLTLNSVVVNDDNDRNKSYWNGSFAFAGTGTTSLLSTLTDGTKITFMIVANDSAGNIRNFSNAGKGFNITLDGTAPDIVLSLDSSRIATQNQIKATCTVNDTSPVTYKITLNKPSKATVVKTPADGVATFKAVDTGEAGGYSVDCQVTDAVNFKTTVSKTFTAYYEGEASVSEVEEEEEAEKKVAEVDLSKAVNGQAPVGTVIGLQGESTTFTLDGETEHTLTFLEVTANSATIRLESTPVDVKLNLGETKEVDLDGDGSNDVVVTLDSIKDEEAKVSIKPTVIPKAVEEAPMPVEQPKAEKPSRAGVVVVVLVILVVVVAAYFLLKGKRKGKKGEITFTNKDLSSEFEF